MELEVTKCTQAEKFRVCRENLAILERPGLAPVRGFPDFGLLANEADLQLFAVYSFELTATIRKPYGRKQKKELVQGQSLHRGLNLKCRSDI
jgi:hypothetical protein